MAVTILYSEIFSSIFVPVSVLTASLALLSLRAACGCSTIHHVHAAGTEAAFVAGKEHH